MKLGVMQPYIFPYIGYYQLVNAVDKFVFYDDVNFIKGGYINRNKILSSGKEVLFTIPVPGASSNKLISDLCYDSNVKKILKTIEQSYGKAPYFDSVYPLVERVLSNSDRDVTVMASMSVTLVFSYLGLKTSFYISSEIKNNKELNRTDRLIEMSQMLGCDEYVNSPGGKLLYKDVDFEDKGVKLSFIEGGNTYYSQGGRDFVPNLSIIDVLMWNSKVEVIELLGLFEIR